MLRISILKLEQQVKRNVGEICGSPKSSTPAIGEIVGLPKSSTAAFGEIDDAVFLAKPSSNRIDFLGGDLSASIACDIVEAKVLQKRRSQIVLCFLIRGCLDEVQRKS